MDKSVIGLIAAIGAVTPFVGAAAAAVTSEDAHRALQASSISELLEPTSNAAAILGALDAQAQGEAAKGDAKGVQLAQFYHHHHHHHHFYHHHHHHHFYHHHHHGWCWYHPRMC